MCMQIRVAWSWFGLDMDCEAALVDLKYMQAVVEVCRIMLEYLE